MLASGALLSHSREHDQLGSLLSRLSKKGTVDKFSMIFRKGLSLCASNMVSLWLLHNTGIFFAIILSSVAIFRMVLFFYIFDTRLCRKRTAEQQLRVPFLCFPCCTCGPHCGSAEHCAFKKQVLSRRWAREASSMLSC